MATTFTTTYAFDKPALGDTGWGNMRNTNMDDIDSELSKPRIIFNSPAVAGTTTLDLALARVFVFTVNQVTTIAFSNVPSSSFAVNITLVITNGAAFAVTWPGSVVWMNAVLPTFRTSGVDVVDMATKDGGTTWYATIRADQRGPAGTATTGYLPERVLFQTGGQTTNSTVEVSLTSFSLPANALSTNNQMVRITADFVGPGANTSSINIKFGATTLFTRTIPTGGQGHRVVIILRRTGAATQQGFAISQETPNVITHNTPSPAETLSGAVLIDFRGNVNTAGTLTMYTALVEYLSV